VPSEPGLRHARIGRIRESRGSEGAAGGLRQNGCAPGCWRSLKCYKIRCWLAALGGAYIIPPAPKQLMVPDKYAPPSDLAVLFSAPEIKNLIGAAANCVSVPILVLAADRTRPRHTGKYLRTPRRPQRRPHPGQCFDCRALRWPDSRRARQAEAASRSTDRAANHSE